MSESIIKDVSTASSVSEEVSAKVIEEFLMQIHKMQYERKPNHDLIAALYCQLPTRAFFHLLGFIEQFSERSAWESGFINEYLGRLPPCDRWRELAKEMKDWKAALK